MLYTSASEHSYLLQVKAGTQVLSLSSSFSSSQPLSSDGSKSLTFTLSFPVAIAVIKAFVISPLVPDELPNWFASLHSPLLGAPHQYRYRLILSKYKYDQAPYLTERWSDFPLLLS